MFTLPRISLLSPLKRLWNDREGFVLSTELILVCSVAVIGLVGGLTVLRSGISTEMSAVAQEFQDLRHSVVAFDEPNEIEIQSSDTTSKCVEVEFVD